MSNAMQTKMGHCRAPGTAVAGVWASGGTSGVLSLQSFLHPCKGVTMPTNIFVV